MSSVPSSSLGYLTFICSNKIYLQKVVIKYCLMTQDAIHLFTIRQTVCVPIVCHKHQAPLISPYKAIHFGIIWMQIWEKGTDRTDRAWSHGFLNQTQFTQCTSTSNAGDLDWGFTEKGGVSGICSILGYVRCRIVVIIWTWIFWLNHVTNACIRVFYSFLGFQQYRF